MYFKKGLDVIAEALKYPLLVISIVSSLIALALLSLAGILIMSDDDDESDGTIERMLESASKACMMETWKWNHKR